MVTVYKHRVNQSRVRVDLQLINKYMANWKVKVLTKMTLSNSSGNKIHIQLRPTNSCEY